MSNPAAFLEAIRNGASVVAHPDTIAEWRARLPTGDLSAALAAWLRDAILTDIDPLMNITQQLKEELK